MMDALEGYADGLAGAGMQDRPIMPLGRESYESGFFAGSLDRKTMLAPDAFHRWADGLMNSTAGDVMQPVGVAGSEEYKAEQRAHNRNVSAQIDTLQRAGFVSDGDTWADGMGDGNG